MESLMRESVKRVIEYHGNKVNSDCKVFLDNSEIYENVFGGFLIHIQLLAKENESSLLFFIQKGYSAGQTPLI